MLAWPMAYSVSSCQQRQVRDLHVLTMPIWVRHCLPCTFSLLPLCSCQPAAHSLPKTRKWLVMRYVCEEFTMRVRMEQRKQQDKDGANARINTSNIYTCDAHPCPRCWVQLPVNIESWSSSSVALVSAYSPPCGQLSKPDQAAKGHCLTNGCRFRQPEDATSTASFFF